MITYAKDVTERMIRAFVVAFAGSLSVQQIAASFGAKQVIDVQVLERLAGSGCTAGMAAVGSLLISLFAKNRGENGTASLAPVTKPDPQYDLSDVDVVTADSA